ncbi:MAG: hypothetical protein ABFS03_12020 [Chloroflexota bacterium]
MTSKLKTQPLDRLLASTPGSVALVMLTVIVAAGALTLLYGLSINLPVIFLTGLVLTLLGIVSALSARVLLRRNTHALRLFSTLTALMLGLITIGMITKGAVGINLISSQISSPNWTSLFQVFWSSLAAWLTLNAWRKPIRIKESPSAAPKKIKARKPKRSRSSIRRSQIRMPRFRMPFSLPSKNGTGKKPGNSPLSVKRRPIYKRKSGPQVRLNKPTVKRSSKMFRLRRRPEPVKLVGVVEHNCPFCLEPVQKKDPRGLKICSVCKTWHHADCWDMTGECQIPHQH